MLVLTIKEGQAVEIGDCRVHVIRRQGRAVKIGIDAPRDVTVRRGPAADEEPTT